MTDLDPTLPPGCAPAADRVVCRDGLDRALLAATARAVRRLGCEGLDHVPVLARHGGLSGTLRRSAQAADACAEALPADVVARVDAGAVAAWLTAHYPDAAYPAVVLGSPHGAAAHLAAALGAPWLPTGFTISVRWPEGTAADWGGAFDLGAELAYRLVAADPSLTVRQVHDPVRRGQLCGSTLTLHVRWRRLPQAYRDFLGDRLRPGASALVMRDTRTWPVLESGPGHTFQVGSPVAGWEPEDYTMDNPSFARLLRELADDRWIVPYPGLARRYAERAGEPEFERDLRQTFPGPVNRVLYPTPEAFSACVADLHREWLLAEGRGGARCIVETEHLLDPWQVRAAGLVPYWCETGSRRAAAGAEWWLAGSRRFDTVDVLPTPPGPPSDAYATPGQWRAVASFAKVQGRVDREAMRRYTQGALPTGHAATVLQAHPRPRVAPPPVQAADPLGGLRRTGEALGVLVL